MSDYKSTLNLPETGFPMRGDLAKREPGMLARWTDDDLYGIIRAAKKANSNGGRITGRALEVIKI